MFSSPLRLGLLAALLLAITTGCGVNPVTGKQELNLVSEAQELKIGKEQYAPSRQSQGGDYQVDPKVQAYVQEVGDRLAKVSDRKLPYEFHVINSSVPNAWALPGGKIAINRGLLTELQSEAELAAVLGHEIVHAAARHGAQGMQRGMLLQGAVMGTAITTRDQSYAKLATLGAGIGSQLISTRYGRDAERESDHYGMSYMVRAGFDPQGAVELQRTFVKLSEGRQQKWLQGLFASHPPSRERVKNNQIDATTHPKGGELGKARYQRMMARLRDTKPAYKAFDQASKALAEGDTDKARGLVKKALKIEPREALFHALLGDAEVKDKNHKAALTHFDKAIDLNGDYFYYPLRRGLLNEKLEKHADARRDLERSTQLLPTASAYNALGNLARIDGDLKSAKDYYGRAAGQKGPDGKAALGSLVEIDLPANPGRYLKLENRRSKSGHWLLLISNPTPRAVSELVIELEYPDALGQKQRRRIEVAVNLGSGDRKTLDLKIAIDPKLARHYQSTLVAAGLAH